MEYHAKIGGNNNDNNNNAFNGQSFEWIVFFHKKVNFRSVYGLFELCIMISSSQV